MYHQPQPEASSAVQVGDVPDHGAVDPQQSQHRSLVVVVVGTTQAGFRSSRLERLPSAAAAEAEAETAAQRIQSLVEDYQAPEQAPSLRERR